MPNTVTLALAAPRLALRRLHPSLGAEVHGIDMSAPLGEAELTFLRCALRDHLVVVLPGQYASPEAQIAFTQQLGAIQLHPLAEVTLPGLREVVVEEPSRDAQDLLWHADLAWADSPNLYSVLAAGAQTVQGAATDFSSQVAAYARLDPWLMHQIEYLDAEHDHPRRRVLAQAAPRHPLVHIDRESGRRSLMPGGATARHVPGLSAEDSADLLHRLRGAATHPAVTLTHQWRAGDVVVWDNLAVLHRHGTVARPRLNRTMVRGAQPLGPAGLATPWMSAG